MILALHTGERRVIGGLRPEQKVYSLLRKLVSCLSQARDLVVDHFAGITSATVEIVRTPGHRLFAECGPDLECFRSVEEVLLT